MTIKKNDINKKEKKEISKTNKNIKEKTNTAIIKPMIEMITCNTKIPPKNKNMI